MLRKLRVVPLALALVAVLAVPAGALASRSGSPNGNIVEVLVAKSSSDGFDSRHDDYDLLVTAVTAAGLGGALSDPAASLTVLAPDDAAFIRTARSLGYHGWSERGAWEFLVDALTDLGGGDPIPTLTTILLYHVAGERLDVVDVLFAGRIDTLAEASFGVRFLQLVDNAPNLRNPSLNLLALQRDASNGVVHGITRVLIPIDIG